MNIVTACSDFIVRHCQADTPDMRRYRGSCLRLWVEKYGRSTAESIERETLKEWKSHKRKGAPFSPEASLIGTGRRD